MSIAEKEYKSRGKIDDKKIKNVETVPDWFDKKINESKVSSDEEKDFLERLRKARGES